MKAENAAVSRRVAPGRGNNGMRVTASATGSSTKATVAPRIKKAAVKQLTPKQQHMKRKTPVRRKGPIKLASPARAEAYAILECLGSGTYGKVYKVRRKQDGAILVLKQVSMEGLSVGAVLC